MVQSIQFIFWLASSLIAPETPTVLEKLESPIIFVQVPTQAEKPTGGGPYSQDYGIDSRLVLLSPDGTTEVISRDFAGASDPEISFDGTKILFSGKRKATDHWNIFEMRRDGSELRQITRDLGDCRNPIYQSTLYTIVSTDPWYQISFTSTAAGERNEYGSSTSTSLYSCKLDGSEPRRLTHNISSDFDPTLLPDGRVLFASWQRATLAHGERGRIPLFAINLDGTDFSLFAAEGKPFKRMPCITAGGTVVFLDSEEFRWDGSGQLASVKLRRNLHSYLRLTQLEQGLYHSPSALPDGSLLVSRRPRSGSGTHGIYRFDPRDGSHDLLFDDPSFHDIQAKLMLPRDEPDGRSSVVNSNDPNGQFYCLNTEISDLPSDQRVEAGTIKRLRVLEGVPNSASENGPPQLVPRRLLGEIPVQSDGSFFIEVPADIPIQLQTLDENGMALRSCGWIWVKNHEPRGCIGCHEDGELTPENRLVEAVKTAPYQLTLPAHRRRTVSFEEHVAPILASKCASASCHARSDATLKLDPEASPSSLYNTLMGTEESSRFVHPGKARTSPLIWHVFGHETSRPWDSVSPFPIPDVSSAFTARERRVLVEWIDMGTTWRVKSQSAKTPGGTVSSGEGE